jgi:hypothetical protein
MWESDIITFAVYIWPIDVVWKVENLSPIYLTKGNPYPWHILVGYWGINKTYDVLKLTMHFADS